MTYEGPGFDHGCDDDSCSCHEWFAEEKDREIESLRARVKELEAELHALKQQAGEPVAITDEMALGFHLALTDGSIGREELNEIKTGLRGAFANLRPSIPEGEPVAWMLCETGGDCWFRHNDDAILRLFSTDAYVPLYLRPSIPEEMVLVSREPTKAMLEAWGVAQLQGFTREGIWEAMIEAAQKEQK